MRWDRSHESSNVDDLRGQRMSGGGGLPLGALVAAGSRFGWKGFLVALLVIGATTDGGSSLCSSGGGPTSQVATPPTSGQSDELSKFVGFVLDDVQGSIGKQLNGYQATRLVLFRGAIGSACGSATSA